MVLTLVRWICKVITQYIRRRYVNHRVLYVSVVLIHILVQVFQLTSSLAKEVMK